MAEKQEETAVAKYNPNLPVGNQGTLKSLLNSPAIMRSFAEVAPKHLTPERIVKMVLLATSRQPKLLDCSQESFLKAAMTSGELGLDCSGTLGRAYLVPFRNNKTGKTEAQFMAGYLGLMDLARRSGEIESITADIVYKDDVFVYEKGLEERLVHKPDLESNREDRDILGAYMICRFRPTGHHIEFMTKRQIEKVRARSRAAQSGPWVTDYAAMCKKTVLRAGLKFCPLSIETLHAIAKTDDEFSDSIVTMEREQLRETNGREKWGLNVTVPEITEEQETTEPPIDVTPEPEQPPADETKTEPAKSEPPKDSKVVTGLKKLFAERGKLYDWDTAAKKRDALDEAFKAAGISSWSEVTLPEHEMKMQEWLDTCFPEDKKS